MPEADRKWGQTRHCTINSYLCLFVAGVILSTRKSPDEDESFVHFPCLSQSSPLNRMALASVTPVYTPPRCTHPTHPPFIHISFREQIPVDVWPTFSLHHFSLTYLPPRATAAVHISPNTSPHAADPCHTCWREVFQSLWICEALNEIWAQ